MYDSLYQNIIKEYIDFYLFELLGSSEPFIVIPAKPSLLTIILYFLINDINIYIYEINAIIVFKVFLDIVP